MTRTLWCNPALGVAGDMLLGALVDVGADEGFVRDQLARLALDGWSLELARTTRGGLVAARAQVHTEEQHHHRSWSTIDALLAASTLEAPVADGARRTFRALGEAEARVHGIELDAVHFHEVGALDAIVDIVGCWAALTSLAVHEVVSGPVGLGGGSATMAHGRVPVPAPAVLQLLVDAPTVPVDTDAETATPTGVALLVTMADRWGPPPAGVLRRSGRGAGRRDPDSHPNVVTVATWERTSDGADQPGPVAAALIETNVDDVTPEVLAHVVDRALAAGADDAWTTAIVMKKGRPAHLVSVLCRPELAAELRTLVAAETGTLGLRERRVDKHELPRRVERVHVGDHEVRIKVGPHGAKPEHDDVAVAAAHLGRTHRDVAAEALERFAAAQVELRAPDTPTHLGAPPA